MDRINVAFASNEAYSQGLLISLSSMAMYVSKEATLNVYIIDGGMLDSTYDNLVLKVSKFHKNITFSRYVLSGSDTQGFPLWRGNTLTYARYKLPELLKDEEYVIYSDVDTLWLANVEELWRQRTPRYAVLGVHDELAIKSEPEWWEKHGYEYEDEKYFNAGILLMNLVFFRKEDIVKKCRDVICKHRDILYPDQTALNIVLQKSVMIIEDRWMRFTWCLRKDDTCKDVVFHYAGDVPWKRNKWFLPITDPVMLWYKVYAEVYEKALWQSLRDYLSIRDILRGRLVYYLSNTYVVGRMWGLMMALVNRSKAWQLVVRMCQPLHGR